MSLPGNAEGERERSIMAPAAGFDAYAMDYDAALSQGLRFSGEGSEYFARTRIAWVRQRLAGLGVMPRRVLDFGCGTGAATPHFLEIPGVERVVGVDVSQRLLAVARAAHRSQRAEFLLRGEPLPCAFDVAYCNGVFHHIPPAERRDAVELVAQALRPGGIFAFWENNPWNPGTRWVMSRIPFDRDAITLTPPEARALLSSSGFEVLRTDFLFIFPRALRWLRRLETQVVHLPFGGQYLVLCRRLA
jgi:SAM-dependent methyltransferase